ncbi:MAG: hypothetical protein H0X33_06770 [Taibaiella sp.]|nr:hypothetical protein [Taibaiella sp.]
MRKKGSVLFIFFAIVAGLAACQKWQDPKGYTDPRLTNPYCNDPYAVNYNWGFPGKPDNTICFYPTDGYRGIYTFIDSVRLADNSFSYRDSVTLMMFALSKTKLGVIGLCTNGDTLRLSVDRSMTATVDTTLRVDTTKVGGQLLCGVYTDTISGRITKDLTDTTNKTFFINFKVLKDSTAHFLTGTAHKVN